MPVHTNALATATHLQSFVLPSRTIASREFDMLRAAATYCRFYYFLPSRVWKRLQKLAAGLTLEVYAVNFAIVPYSHKGVLELLEGTPHARLYHARHGRCVTQRRSPPVPSAPYSHQRMQHQHQRQRQQQIGVTNSLALTRARATYYAMAGRPMQPRFMFLWPGAHVAAVPKAHVEQVAKQLLEVEAAKVDTIPNDRKLRGQGGRT